MTRAEDLAITHLSRMLAFAKNQRVPLPTLMRGLTDEEISLMNLHATDRRIRDNLTRSVNTTPTKPTRRKGR
ncbi:MAG: hypothetical protein IPM18_05810 [Phycisphaerales bacterium]|nr:hypothetical protein [Phycisphaerales bacterium]